MPEEVCNPWSATCEWYCWECPQKLKTISDLGLEPPLNCNCGKKGVGKKPADYGAQYRYRRRGLNTYQETNSLNVKNLTQYNISHFF